MAVNIKKEFGNNRNRKPDITNLVYGKVPPQAPELEEAVLGAMMLEKDKVDDVLAIIDTPDTFYTDQHQKIFAAIQSLYNQGYAVDLLTVTEQLRKTNELELVGGVHYLMKITMAISSGANVEAHAYIVKEKYIKREIIRISGLSIGDAYEDSTDALDLLELAETELFSIHNSAIKKEAVHVGKVAHENSIELEEKRHSTERITGVPSGFTKIDDITSGWQPTDLIVLAARPATGKTALTLNWAYNAAVNKKPVLLFSLEMGANQLENRLRSSVSGVPLDNILKPYKMTESHIVDYQKAEKHLNTIPLYIDDSAGVTAMQIRAKARKMKKKYGIEMIMIDYLQLMTGDGKSTNRAEEIAKISRELKKLAKELKIPIIALSQLNRDVESRKDGKPKASDLRESGAIEQDADVIILLSKPTEEEEKKNTWLQNRILVDFAKFRNGTPDNISLYFQKEIQKFHDESPFTPSYAPPGFIPMKQAEQKFQTNPPVPPGYFNDDKQF